MGYIQLSRDDISDIIDKSGDQQVKENKELIIQSLFLDDCYIDAHKEQICPEQDSFEGKPVQLYKYKYHIRLKDCLYELFYVCIKNPKIAINAYKLFTHQDVNPQDFVSIIPNIIKSFKRIFSELIIKLDDTNFCIYLQAITHLGERIEFSEEDMLRWVPKNRKCNMHTQRWSCDFLENGLCTMQSDEDILKIFKNFIEIGVFSPQNNKYIINY